jgi:hypothetical protein
MGMRGVAQLSAAALAIAMVGLGPANAAGTAAKAPPPAAWTATASVRSREG